MCCGLSRCVLYLTYVIARIVFSQSMIVRNLRVALLNVGTAYVIVYIPPGKKLRLSE